MTLTSEGRTINVEEGKQGFQEVDRAESTKALGFTRTPDESLRSIRSDSFYPDDLDRWPTPASDYLPNRPVRAKFTYGDSVYLPTAYNHDTGVAQGHFGTSEVLSWGEFDLIDLERTSHIDMMTGRAIVAERDTGFEPVTAGEAQFEHDLTRSFNAMSDSEREALVQFRDRAEQFASTVDSPFASDEDRSDFAWYCTQRYIRDPKVATMSGYALALGWLAKKRG